MKTLAALVGSLAPLFSNQVDSPLVLTLRADKTSLLTGEPCSLLLEIKNNSRVAVVLSDPLDPSSGSSLKITISSGERVPAKIPLCAGGSFGDAYVKIPSGGAVHRIIDLNEIFAVPGEGDIRIVMEYVVPAKTLRIYDDQTVKRLKVPIPTLTESRTVETDTSIPGTFSSNELTITFEAPGRSEDRQALAAWKEASTSSKLDFDSKARMMLSERFPYSVYGHYARVKGYWEQITRRTLRRERWLEKISRKPELADTLLEGENEKPITANEVRDWSMANAANPLADDIWFQFSVGPYAREHSVTEVQTVLGDLIKEFPGRTGAVRASAYLQWVDGYSFFSP